MLTLDAEGMSVTIVGGGAVAQRRGEALAASGARLFVVAPEISRALADAAEASGGRVCRRAYQTEDLDTAQLVVAATADPELNRRIADEAEARGLLVNCASDPEAGRVGFVAERSVGDIRLGVETGGVSAAAAAAIANRLAEDLEQTDWAGVLEVARDWRPRIQQALPPGPARQAALRELTGPAARQRFAQGNAQALADFYASLIEEKPSPAPAPSGGER
ncbi:MAG: bifunctional precorrin-2 dehydrogenase/sirohydrochlorin ferrochelatase [Planctomycetota bacterium]